MEKNKKKIREQTTRLQKLKKTKLKSIYCKIEAEEITEKNREKRKKLKNISKKKK